ncbi:probable nucleoside diphosphate kinase 5 isoform X3 [Andrographis paniculata]|uniref:probable nucleoside diphosphate kinase 5 isoform X3 n=1 Tax=Andrographis paniculata TaxID=175694 RepID=UPI0021E794E3|nr:probable nucleoside diphosphate kinase 5 isoform X3 [Andrographis paniculata]
MDLRFTPFLVLCLAVFSRSRSSAEADTAKEKTLAMVKPDGVEGNFVDTIKKAILDSGFAVTQEMQLKLDEDVVTRFYAEHSSKGFFPSLVRYMTSGSVVIMVLEKENAVADWRDLIGPTDATKAKVTHPKSIRALCGIDLQRNCVHGSDSPQSAAREISFFFNEAFSVASKHDEL